MRSKLTLLSTAAAFAFGLAGTAALAADATGDAPGAKSDITIVRDNTANAPGGTGVEESTETRRHRPRAAPGPFRAAAITRATKAALAPPA